MVSRIIECACVMTGFLDFLLCMYVFFSFGNRFAQRTWAPYTYRTIMYLWFSTDLAWWQPLETTKIKKTEWLQHKIITECLFMFELLMEVQKAIDTDGSLCFLLSPSFLFHDVRFVLSYCLAHIF